ncbi:Kelch repeat-containing protein [Methylotuvimicrobium buryatense]|nr:kelch repeat-containing protein [Methylotuvimicrobium buryatense]
MITLNKPSIWHNWFLVAILFMSPSLAVASFHQDIEVFGTGNSIQAGFCSNTALGCSIVGVEHLGLPPNTLPTDFATGKDIYVSAFNHIVFTGRHETADPGFQSPIGGLLSQELVSYEAIGRLEFWNPASGTWGLAPENVKIRLAGGLKINQVADQSCGLVFCPPKITTQSSFSIYTSNGIEGETSLIVGQASNNGSFHSHLDWFLETSAGSANGGPQGAYLVEMRMFSDKRQTPSDPFYILFNNQLSSEEFQLAVSQRVLGTGNGEGPEPTPEPEPVAWTELDLPVSDALEEEPGQSVRIGERIYLLPHSGSGVFEVSGELLSGNKNPVIADGKLYVFNNEKTLIYEYQNGQFHEPSEEADSIPIYRSEASIVSTDRGIFVFGGKETRPNGKQRMSNRLDHFDPETKEWQRLRNIPGVNQREGAALAEVNLQDNPFIYLMGGGVLDRQRLTGAFAVYDIITNRWQTRGMTPIPTPRAFTAGLPAPVLDGKIYLIGGRSVNSVGGLVKSDKVEIYDPVSNTWQVGPNLPKEISEPVSFTADGKIYVIDGSQEHAESKITAWELDDVWKPWLEENQTCDLDGDGQFTNRDVNLFARACRAGTAYWNCDLTEGSPSIARNIREYRLQWREYRNKACP